jgi:DNA-binding GntR family transcriptional regulator
MNEENEKSANANGPTHFGDRRSLSGEIASVLRGEIVTGRLRPGNRLGHDDLARRLGVSAMPVREALLVLTGEGIVASIPRRGFRVIQITRRDFSDIFSVHAFVAGELAAAAALVFTEEHALALLTLQRQIDAVAAGVSGSTDATVAGRIADLNFQFHRTMNRIPDAERLRWFLRAATRYVPDKFYEDVPGWVETTVSEHVPLIESLARRDPAAARSLAAGHVSRAGDLVISHLEQAGYWGP